MELGSHYLGDRRCSFALWAPLFQQVSLHLTDPVDRLIPLERDEWGYWQVTLDEIDPGTRYCYQWDGESDRPDPASKSQPDGVHKASAVVDPRFDWTDTHWQGIALEQMVMYELHVGTFTPEGTFDAVIPRLPDLKELGVNAIEIMPVAQFPGERNWGYDGVFPFAVQHSYGGVHGLQRLVNACHNQGIAVILDVVYNHLGPEGNYLWGVGTYFTDHYRTPWGSAVNFDTPYSDGVRYYFAENVRYWFETCHLDALRLDAVHAIYDFGAKHILLEMAEVRDRLSQQLGRKLYLIAESDLNDPRIIRPAAQGGYNLDAQWSDDFHHALHTVLTGEAIGYYQDYGTLAQFAKALAQSYVYTWDYSKFRKRYHGADASDRPASQFVVCTQNHDQVGNRMLGDRLCHLIPFEAQKLAAGAMLLSPYIPLLFMGEEYAEPAPFLYFVSHGDPLLIEAVRAGRKAEFAEFHEQGEAPDPEAAETFERSKLNWDKRLEGQHQQLWRFYQKLLTLRTEIPALATLSKDQLEVALMETDLVLKLRRWQQNSQIISWFNFGSEAVTFSNPIPPGTWTKQLDSADPTWGGTGSTLPDVIPGDRTTPVPQETLTLPPQSFVLYTLST